MTPVRLIGIGLAAAGALALAAVAGGLAFHQQLFGIGYNSKSISIGGFIGIVGFALLVSGLRITSNSGKD